MTDPTANPPDPVTPHRHDLSSATFRFDTNLWFEAPEYGASDPNDKELIYRRQTNDNTYRTTGNATKWNRFTTLAYYALDDGMKFDKEWEKFETDPLIIHRIIWYNYMYHVDRDMDVVPKLNAWANQIAHPYLLEHEPASIDMDTMKYAYKDVLARSDDMEIDNNMNDGEWIPVTDRGGARNRNKNNGSQNVNNTNRETGISTAPGFNHPPEENSSPTQKQPTTSNIPSPAQVTPEQPPANNHRQSPTTHQPKQLLKDP